MVIMVIIIGSVTKETSNLGGGTMRTALLGRQCHSHYLHNQQKATCQHQKLIGYGFSDVDNN